MHLRALPAVLLCCAALVSCGDDDEGGTTAVTTPPVATAPSPTATPTGPSEPTFREPVPADAPPAVTPPTEPSSGDCGEAGGLRVRVVTGEVTCAAGRAAIAAYDALGEKVQEVEGFICEGGEAATRPLVVTCVSAVGEVTGSTPDG